MDEKKRGLSLLTFALIGIILVLGVFLIIESIFIVAAGNILPDFSSPLTSKVAVIYVEGEMVTDGAPGPGYAGSGDIVRQLREAEANPGVKAIVLRINSPGGSPVAAQDIYSQLLKTRAGQAGRRVDERHGYVCRLLHILRLQQGLCCS